ADAQEGKERTFRFHDAEALTLRPRFQALAIGSLEAGEQDSGAIVCRRPRRRGRCRRCLVKQKLIGSLQVLLHPVFSEGAWQRVGGCPALDVDLVFLPASQRPLGGFTRSLGVDEPEYSLCHSRPQSYSPKLA